MSARFTRSAERGQSIPLIALLIVVLIGAVGLAVDVGNDYAQQRNTVRATNAAALAGMNALIQGYSDQSIGQVIQQSLKSNKVDGVLDDPNAVVQPNQRLIEAYYLDSKGNYLLSCVIGHCGAVPPGVTYIQVKVKGTVDTYFARVLQQPTLPVKAQAFAGRCAPVNGVYPIGVPASYLDQVSHKFYAPQDPTDLPYYGTYADPNYPGGLSQRRLYMKLDSNSPGDFDWLRWKSDPNAGSGPELVNMMAGPGDLAAGFDEGLVDKSTGAITWPDKNSQPPMYAGKSVYPIKPHEVNLGDWVYANPGVQIGKAEVQKALKDHIDRKDVLILPIVKPAVGSGADATFQIDGFGQFYLVGIPGYGTGTKAKGGGANSFFDLVYIGTANSIACLSTPAVTSNTLGITGSVFVKPRWGQGQESDQPIAYEIVMDVSGSMSWNFDGQGTKGATINKEANSSGGTTVQCEATATQPNPVVCQGGIDDPWWKVSDRRIYVLKHALIDSGGFIDNLRTNDTMRIITFSSDGISTGTWVDGSQKALLKTKALNAGSYNGDDYRTSGGTPGPKALQQANQVLQNSPPSPIPGAKPYRHAVIYLTDGVANIFLDGTTNYAKDICSEFNGDNRALNTPRCQFDPPPDYLPNASHGMRPISSMIDQASKMKTKFPDMQLFVIALAQVNPLGLDQVASNPKMLYLARQAGLVDTVLGQIRQKVVGTCTESGGAAWINLIDAAHTASMPAPYTLPSGVFGYVYLFDKNYTPVSVPWTGQGADPRGPKVNAIPITQDSESGTLGYSIPTDKGLAAGVYYQQAYVNYKAAAPQGDGVSRQYDTIMDGLAPVPFAQFTLTPSEVLGASVMLKPVRLDLDPVTALCP